MTTTTAPIATAAPRRSRRVLVPLATLAAAGALAVGSGASFSSQSDNAISTVTAGTLKQANSRADTAIFDVGNIKPGDTITGSVTITNSGSLPGTFKVTETALNGFSDAALLTMKVTDDKGNTVHDGTFGALGGDDDVAELGTFAAGEARTYTYVVHLDVNAGDDNQGDAATATYVWDSVQLTGDENVDERLRTDIASTRTVNTVPAPVTAP